MEALHSTSEIVAIFLGGVGSWIYVEATKCARAGPAQNRTSSLVAEAQVHDRFERGREVLGAHDLAAAFASCAAPAFTGIGRALRAEARLLAATIHGRWAGSVFWGDPKTQMPVWAHPVFLAEGDGPLLPLCLEQCSFEVTRCKLCTHPGSGIVSTCGST